MERAVTVTVDLKIREEWTAQERAQELRELAVSAGAKVIKELIVRKDLHITSPLVSLGDFEVVCNVGELVGNTVFETHQVRRHVHDPACKAFDKFVLIDNLETTLNNFNPDGSFIGEVNHSFQFVLANNEV